MSGGYWNYTDSTLASEVFKYYLRFDNGLSGEKHDQELKNAIRINPLTLTCIRKDRIVHISITQLGRSLGAITFECIPMGLCKIVKNTTKKLQNDDVQSVITVYASTMAIMAFGGQFDAPPKEKKPNRNNESSPSKKKSTSKKNKSNV